MIKEMILEKGCMHKRHLGSGSSPDQYTSTKGLVSLQKRKEARDNESEKAIILRDSKSKAVKLMEPTNKYMAQLLCLMIMPYKFEILIRRSTLQSASETEATVGCFPFGGVPLIPSQVTLIPTFLLFTPPIFTFTFVSISIVRGAPPFFFRSDLRLVTESASRSSAPDIKDRNTVWFLVALVKAGIEPLARRTELEKQERVKGS